MHASEDGEEAEDDDGGDDEVDKDDGEDGGGDGWVFENDGGRKDASFTDMYARR
jgi:hypothetical protein